MASAEILTSLLKLLASSLSCSFAIIAQVLSFGKGRLDPGGDYYCFAEGCHYISMGDYLGKLMTIVFLYVIIPPLVASAPHRGALSGKNNIKVLSVQALVFKLLSSDKKLKPFVKQRAPSTQQWVCSSNTITGESILRDRAIPPNSRIVRQSLQNTRVT